MLLLLTALVVPAQAKKKGKWKKIYTKAGITVHRREIEGSNHVEFRGRGALNANIVRCLAVLADSKRAHEWIDRNLGITILKKINEKERIYYSAVKAPWPLSDRDFVASKFSLDERNGWIHIRSYSIKHSYKPKSGRVRMPFTRVRWSFKPLTKNKVWLEFRAHADPGGVIPSWVANMVAKELPYKTIRNFRKRVKSNKVRQKFLTQYANYADWGAYNPSSLKNAKSSDKPRKKKKKKRKKKKKKKKKK